jgi:hypothetical protein
MPVSQFYVTLPSTSSRQFYPENKLSSYTTKLHTPLKLNGDWEVSLVEMIYPRTWYNISGDDCTIRYKTTGDDEQLESASLSPGYYENVEQIIVEISKVLPAAARRNMLMYVKSQSRKMVIGCNNGACLQLTEHISRILGFENTTIFTKENYGSFQVDVHRGVYTFYVYTDIISSQYIGDAHAPLLRTVDVDHSIVGGMVCRTYNSPHYVPIKIRDIETIKVDIRLDSGELVPFESGQVISKLHFRLKRSPYLI